MKNLLLIVAFSLVGYGIGWWGHLNLVGSSLFWQFAVFALVVGLYTSVAGVDLETVV